MLKLYDRRFGTTIRKRPKPTSRTLEEHPHTASMEAAYCEFIRKDEIGAFLDDFEAENRSRTLPVRAWSLLDGSPEGSAKYEAVMWHKCREYFDRETRAYAKLSELQGKVIPRLLAHVRLSLPQDGVVPCPADLLQRPEARQYLEVRGILMELVDGYELSELLDSPVAPSDPERWRDIIQAAADGAHEINLRGVRMSDCSMYNVMVDRKSHQPFIVDLAQCGFIEEMYEEDDDEEDDSSSDDGEAQDCRGESSSGDMASEGDHQGSESEYGGSQVIEESNPEIRYWNSVRSCDNPGAIGLVMGARLLREKGVTITTRYPDYDAIIADIRRKREQQELSENFEKTL